MTQGFPETASSDINTPPSVFDPVHLDTDRLKIRPLSSVPWKMIAEGVLYEGSWHSRTWGVETPEDLRKRYENALNSFEKKILNLMVFLSPDETEVYGMSNFMNIEPKNKRTEIGGTWISKKWQRTFVNSETKYELLKYCFETLKFRRVEFRIDKLNVSSQRAIERIGIPFEGVMRKHVIIANGESRDYHLYAAVNEDWAAIKINLNNLLQERKRQS